MIKWIIIFLVVTLAACSGQENDGTEEQMNEEIEMNSTEELNLDLSSDSADVEIIDTINEAP